MLEHLAVDRNFAEFVSATDMGRSASKVEDFQDCIDVLARAAVALHCERGGYFFLKPSKTGASEGILPLRAGQFEGRLDKDPVVTAKPLVANRLTFPPPPAFDPRPFFDHETLDRYEKPITHGRKPEELDEDPPRVTERATHSERLKLYKKLADSGRLKPVSKDTFHAGFTSGLFAVVKDQNRDRMILDSDARPANMLSKGQQKWSQTMASGMTLAYLHLQPDEVLVASGEDLKDYFYQFVVGEERCSKNALAVPVQQSEAREIFGPNFQWSEDPVWLGLETLSYG